MSLKEKSLEKLKLFKRRAEKALNDSDKTKKEIAKATKKMSEAEGDGPLVELLDSIKDMLDLLKSWITGEYKAIPTVTMVIILGAIMYFVSPFDALSDFIPFGGFIDDGIILGLVIKQVSSEINSYKTWKKIRDSEENIIDVDSEVEVHAKEKTEMGYLDIEGNDIDVIVDRGNKNNS